MPQVPARLTSATRRHRGTLPQQPGQRRRWISWARANSLSTTLRYSGAWPAEPPTTGRCSRISASATPVDIQKRLGYGVDARVRSDERAAPDLERRRACDLGLPAIHSGGRIRSISAPTPQAADYWSHGSKVPKALLRVARVLNRQLFLDARLAASLHAGQNQRRSEPPGSAAAGRSAARSCEQAGRRCCRFRRAPRRRVCPCHAAGVAEQPPAQVRPRSSSIGSADDHELQAVQRH